MMNKAMLLITLLMVTLSASNVRNLKYMGTVKDIVVSTQKIRGGTYNFLNGNDFAQFGVFEERTRQKKLFKALNKQFNAGGKSIDSDFDLIKKQTHSLNMMSLELDPVTSFKAYSLIIDKMIKDASLTQVAFFEKASPFVQRSTKVMVNNLLPLSESVGKVRGLGSGVISRGYYEEDEKEYLRDYLDELNSNFSNSVRELEKLQTGYSKKYPKRFNDKIIELNKAITHYTLFIQNRLLEEDDDVKENSNKYFKEGSKIIALIMTLYIINEESVKKTF